MARKKNKNKRTQSGKLKKIKGFSLQVLPFSEISNLTISERVKKVLNLVLSDRVVIMQGKLRAEEEARLIEDTMALVGHIRGFKGVELAVIEPNIEDENVFVRLKHGIANKLVGNNNALTVIGPATVIKDIKRDPKKLELMFS